jgi:hypothetical protein
MSNDLGNDLGNDQCLLKLLRQLLMTQVQQSF